MKKLSLLILLFLFSCSKTEKMSHKTTIIYNGVTYYSDLYTTEVQTLATNVYPNKKIEVTMHTNATEGFVFTYHYTKEHTFCTIANKNTENQDTF